MTAILQCPVCGSRLLDSTDGYQCANRHSFDAAREGYVNVLLAHQKHSKEPGDNADMIRSRRHFLSDGWYDQVSDGINEAISGRLLSVDSQHHLNILDAGCGEGFYLDRLKKHLSSRPGNFSINYYGVDISKFAVQKAAKRDRTLTWLVAGMAALPFTPSSLDVIMNVFSPADVQEFSRILKKTGILVIASPGPKHLTALRKVIYPETREHSPSSFLEKAKGFFSLAFETTVKYQRELTSREAIQDLLSMTPYFWNIDRKTKSDIEKLEHLPLDVDVYIRVFRKPA